MTMKRWHLLVATKMILAVSAVGEANAQHGWIPQPQILPPADQTIVAAPSGPGFAPRRAPGLIDWTHCKGRLERWFVSAEPDTAPLGQSVYQAMTNQIDNGVAVRMILNDFDFEPNSANLNQRGREKLPHLAGLALRYPYLIIVERPSYDPGLATRRVEMARKELSRMSIPLPADRIVEGGTLTRGLDGVEALYLYGNLLKQTQSQKGPTGQGQGGGSTGINTGGSSGSSAGSR